jgi:hypothetical protein
MDLISSFVKLMDKYLELKVIDKKNRIEIINFIDKLNLQKELLDLQKGVSNMKDIKVAAHRLGRKSQSAFLTK